MHLLLEFYANVFGDDFDDMQNDESTSSLFDIPTSTDKMEVDTELAFPKPRRRKAFDSEKRKTNYKLRGVIIEAFRTNDHLTPYQVREFLKKTNQMEDVEKNYPEDPNRAITQALSDLKKEGLISRKNKRQDTPYYPTEELLNLKIDQGRIRQVKNKRDKKQPLTESTEEPLSSPRDNPIQESEEAIDSYEY